MLDADGRRLATVVLRTADQIYPTDQRILERAALVIALLLLFRRSFAEAETRVRGELLDDLLTGRITDADARARPVGVDLEAPMVVVVARYDGAEQGQRARAAF